MDCIHARMLIVLPGRDAQELDADARAGLDQHLEQCADCLAWSHQENRIDECLGNAVRNVPVPAGLPSKILHQLEHQRRPRKVQWISAAAASLLLAMGIGGYVWYTEKPEVTPGLFVQHVSELEIFTPADIEQHFEQIGFTVQAPRAFNFDMCNNYAVASVQGHNVPFIEFFFPGDTEARSAVAHVYVLAENRFNVDEIVKALPMNEPFVTSKHQIEVRRFESHPGFLYILVYTGSKPSVFYARAG